MLFLHPRATAQDKGLCSLAHSGGERTWFRADSSLSPRREVYDVAPCAVPGLQPGSAPFAALSRYLPCTLGNKNTPKETGDVTKD